MPCTQTTCCRKSLVIPLANGSLGNGMNLHAFENQKPETRMTFLPWDTGIPVTKFVETCDQEGPVDTWKVFYFEWKSGKKPQRPWRSWLCLQISIASEISWFLLSLDVKQKETYGSQDSTFAYKASASSAGPTWPLEVLYLPHHSFSQEGWASEWNRPTSAVTGLFHAAEIEPHQCRHPRHLPQL